MIIRHGPEVPKFVFMAVGFETYCHAQSIPQKCHHTDLNNGKGLSRPAGAWWHLARRRGRRLHWRRQRVISIWISSISNCISILICQLSIGAEHRHILTQISCFSPSVFTAARNIKAHRRVRVHFQLWVLDQKLSGLRISNCILHAGTINFWLWLGWLARSTGRPQVAFRMSTKSSTFVISSFSIKKLSSLEQCS